MSIRMPLIPQNRKKGNHLIEHVDYSENYIECRCGWSGLETGPDGENPFLAHRADMGEGSSTEARRNRLEKQRTNEAAQNVPGDSEADGGDTL